MDRRRFLGGIGSGLFLPSFAARAQPATKIQRIGVLLLPPLDTPGIEAYLAAFRQGLREHGLVDGKNLIIEYRSADGQPERLPALANELARLKVEVIAVASSQGARAAL